MNLDPNLETTVPELKPVRWAFVLAKFVPWGVLLSIISAVGAVILYQVQPILALSGGAFFLLTAAFAVYLAQVAYRKEHYQLSDSLLRRHRGGIFSDDVLELDIRNITHVKLRLPWLRYKFFKIGDVFVESAGSGEVEVGIRSVRDPEAVQAQIRTLMQGQGYALTGEELIYETKPDPLGVVIECVSLFLVSAFFILWFAGSAMNEAKLELLTMAMVVLPMLAIAGAGWALHYVDMRRRTYQVFADSVVYTEGFLTRDNAFIPYENIANASTHRTFIDQILGLFDVKVSCQGTRKEIKFRRLRHGEALNLAISRLITQAQTGPGTPMQRKRERQTGTETSQARPSRERAGLVDPSEAWTHEFQMHWARALVPWFLLLPIPPLFLIVFVRLLIKAMVTRYSVQGSSISSRYRFLQVRESDFAYDKVTGVVVRENPWDRLFKTISLRVWSIGSGQALEIDHVKRSELNLDALFRQVGIPPAERQADVPAYFGSVAWLQANLAAVCAVFVLTLGFALSGWLVHAAFFAGLAAVFLGVVVGYLYCRVLYTHQHLHLFPDHVELHTGILWREQFRAAYLNVKKLRILRYPGCDRGSVTFFVAGEQRLSQEQQRTQAAAGGGLGALAQAMSHKQYSFTGHFLAGIDDKLLRLDAILQGLATPASLEAGTALPPTEILREGGQSLGNSLFVLVAASILTVVGIPLLLFTIPWTIIAVRRRRYCVDALRVIVTWGVIYVAQESVLFDRIDSLAHSERFLNKLFKNGNVTLLTAGSSKPDLLLVNMPDHNGFYQDIRERYAV